MLFLSGSSLTFFFVRFFFGFFFWVSGSQESVRRRSGDNAVRISQRLAEFRPAQEDETGATERRRRRRRRDALLRRRLQNDVLAPLKPNERKPTIKSCTVSRFFLFIFKFSDPPLPIKKGSKKKERHLERNGFFFKKNFWVCALACCVSLGYLSLSLSLFLVLRAIALRSSLFHVPFFLLCFVFFCVFFLVESRSKTG